MAKYCITAAKPKNSTQHLKSEFKLWKAVEKDGKISWSHQGWKRGTEIAGLIGAGHQVLTAKKNDTTISTGAAVEMELRISRNESKYKISDMPED